MTHRGILCALAAIVAASACTGSDGGDDSAASTSPPTAPPTTEQSTMSEPDGDDPDGAGEGSAPGGDADSAPEIVWERCGSVECGTLEVPIDHDDPGAGTLDLAVYRRAADGEDRIGSLIVNYGGPGAESGEIFEFDASLLAGALTDRFDLVTWDLRGTGESSRLECDDLLTEAAVAQVVDLDDGVDAEVAEAVDYLEDVNQCSLDSPVRDDLSTTDAARDLDLIRAAVGDEQVTFLGYSYGTQLGWVYATLFPDRVRAMVLDGALPGGYFDSAEGPVAQLAAFERTFRYFVEVCAREERCSARSEGLDVRVERVASDLAEQPIELADGSLWGEVDFRAAILQTMHLPPSSVGADLDRWIRAVDEDRDPSGLIEFAEFGADLLTIGAFEAVICADGAVGPVEETQVAATLGAMVEASPTFGSIPLYLPCEEWDGEITPLPELNTEGAAPLLVVGSTLDPATPYEDAVLLDRQLADSALLTFVGAGHTIVGFDTCVDAKVTDYLENLELPADTSCSAGARYGIALIAGERGIEVTGIEPGSGAAQSSLQAGDVIVAVDGTPTPTQRELPSAAPDVARVFTIERGDETLDIEVVPVRLPWN